MMLLSSLIIALAVVRLESSSSYCRVKFHPVNALSCVRSEFVQTHWEAATAMQCSMLCSKTANCQAFSMSDGPCQLFVFHRCSKNVRECSCTRKAQVYVRQQPRLPAGALCLAGYSDDLCGAKYKFMSCVGNWTRCKDICDAESGLVIMADVIDSNEMLTVGKIVGEKLAEIGNEAAYMYIGGWQPPGSSEPSGGWQWASCGLNISDELWSSREPNDVGSQEDRVGIKINKKFLDLPTEIQRAAGGYCECVSPFD